MHVRTCSPNFGKSKYKDKDKDKMPLLNACWTLLSPNYGTIHFNKLSELFLPKLS